MKIPLKKERDFFIAEIMPFLPWSTKAQAYGKNFLLNNRLQFGFGNLVRQFFIHVREYPSFQFDNRRALALKLFYKKRRRNFRFDDITAGKYVHSRVRILGPCVNRKMRFRYYYHAADTERIEFVEGYVDDSRLGLFSRRDQCVFDPLEVFQNFGVALP